MSSASKPTELLFLKIFALLKPGDDSYYHTETIFGHNVRFDKIKPCCKRVLILITL